MCRGADGSRNVPALPFGEPRRERARDARAASRSASRQGSNRWPGASPRASAALERGVLERQIGRLLERNARAAARYAVSIRRTMSALSGCCKLKWTRAPRMGRLGALERRHLHPSHQCARLDRRGTLEDLHPTHRGRGCLPDSEIRPRHPPDLAPQGRSHPGPHPGLLPWPTPCGRRCRSGNHVQAWAIRPARSSTSSRAFTPPTSYCRWPMRSSANCAFAA